MTMVEKKAKKKERKSVISDDQTSEALDKISNEQSTDGKEKNLNSKQRKPTLFKQKLRKMICTDIAFVALLPQKNDVVHTVRSRN